MTSDQIEAQFILAIDALRREAKHRVASRSFAEFAESVDGYPGIDQVFNGAVQSAMKVWGSPSKVALGPSSIYADIQGVPPEFLNSRALRYAFWSAGEVRASIAMLTHDADTLRSFELTIEVERH